MRATRQYRLEPRYFLVFLAVIGGILIGRMVAGSGGGPGAAFMLPFIPLAVIVLTKPEIGIALAFPVLMLIPYGAINLPLPVLDSPLQLVLIATVGAASLRFVTRHKSILRTWIYYPIAICIMLMVASLALGRGADTNLRLYRFLLSLWPFALVVLMVEKPQQARRFLLSALAPVVLLVVLWLPVMVWFVYTGQSAAGLLRMAYAGTFFEETYPILAFLKPGGVTRSWVVLMVAPILLGVGLLSQDPGRQRLGRLLYLLCATYLFMSTFVGSIVGLVFETLLVIVLVHWLDRLQVRHFGYLVLLVLVVFLVIVLTGASDEIEKRFRVQLAPETVAGVSGRLGAYESGIRLAMKYPLFGIGAYQYGGGTAPSGESVQGHSFWLPVLYEFGIFYALAWVAIVVMICRQCWNLLNETCHEERAVLVGIFAGLVTVVLLSAVNPVLSAPGPDVYFWLFAGLVLLWSDWHRRDPQASLLE